MNDLGTVILGEICVVAIAFCAIVFHENIIEFIGKKLCKYGKHRFKKGKYYCNRCKIARDWPKLTKIEGGKSKKDLIFPKI